MKRYLLKIIRENEAPRPSEDFMRIDNMAFPDVPMYMTQEAGFDTYILIECDKDISIRLQEIAQMENRMAHLIREPNDGSLVFAYPPQATPREPREYTVNVYDENMEPTGETVTHYRGFVVRVLGGESSSYDLLEDAEDFIATLDSEDGYELIDMWEGKPSVIVDGRPSMKKAIDDISGEEMHLSPVIANIKNLWGRDQ